MEALSSIIETVTQVAYAESLVFFVFFLDPHRLRGLGASTGEGLKNAKKKTLYVA